MDNNKNSNTISNPKILSSQKKGKLRIFFGMAEGGVYKFNGKSFDKTF